MENNHFLCGQTITQCYQGMVDGRLIDPQNPLMSRLVDPNSTPLAWFGTGGNMPFDKNSTPNPQAAADIGAWIFAGAKSD